MISILSFVLVSSLTDSPSQAFYDFATRPVLENSSVRNDEPLSVEKDHLKLGLKNGALVVENAIGLGLTDVEATEWLKTVPENLYPLYNLFAAEVAKKIVPKAEGGEGLSINDAAAEAFISLSETKKPKTLNQTSIRLELVESVYSAKLTEQAQAYLKEQDAINQNPVRVEIQTYPYFWPQIQSQTWFNENIFIQREKFPASFKRISGQGFIE